VVGDAPKGIKVGPALPPRSDLKERGSALENVELLSQKAFSGAFGRLKPPLGTDACFAPEKKLEKRQKNKTCAQTKRHRSGEAEETPVSDQKAAFKKKDVGKERRQSARELDVGVPPRPT